MYLRYTALATVVTSSLVVGHSEAQAQPRFIFQESHLFRRKHMRHWRTVLALVLTLGLASIPYTTHADAEEGSMSEQEAHDMQGRQIHGGTEEKTGAKDEAKKETTAHQATSGAHHDSRGGHNDSHEQVEEGSH